MSPIGNNNTVVNKLIAKVWEHGVLIWLKNEANDEIVGHKSQFTDCQPSSPLTFCACCSYAT